MSYGSSSGCAALDNDSDGHGEHGGHGNSGHEHGHGKDGAKTATDGTGGATGAQKVELSGTFQKDVTVVVNSSNVHILQTPVKAHGDRDPDDKDPKSTTVKKPSPGSSIPATQPRGFLDLIQVSSSPSIIYGRMQLEGSDDEADDAIVRRLCRKAAEPLPVGPGQLQGRDDDEKSDDSHDSEATIPIGGWNPASSSWDVTKDEANIPCSCNSFCPSLTRTLPIRLIHLSSLRKK